VPRPPARRWTGSRIRRAEGPLREPEYWGRDPLDAILTSPDFLPVFCPPMAALRDFQNSLGRQGARGGVPLKPTPACRTIRLQITRTCFTTGHLGPWARPPNPLSHPPGPRGAELHRSGRTARSHREPVQPLPVCTSDRLRARFITIIEKMDRGPASRRKRDDRQRLGGDLRFRSMRGPVLHKPSTKVHILTALRAVGSPTQPQTRLRNRPLEEPAGFRQVSSWPPTDPQQIPGEPTVRRLPCSSNSEKQVTPPLRPIAAALRDRAGPSRSPPILLRLQERRGSAAAALQPCAMRCPLAGASGPSPTRGADRGSTPMAVDQMLVLIDSPQMAWSSLPRIQQTLIAPARAAARLLTPGRRRMPKQQPCSFRAGAGEIWPACCNRYRAWVGRSRCRADRGSTWWMQIWARACAAAFAPRRASLLTTNQNPRLHATVRNDSGLGPRRIRGVQRWTLRRQCSPFFKTRGRPRQARPRAAPAPALSPAGLSAWCDQRWPLAPSSRARFGRNPSPAPRPGPRVPRRRRRGSMVRIVRAAKKRGPKLVLEVEALLEMPPPELPALAAQASPDFTAISDHFPLLRVVPVRTSDLRIRKPKRFSFLRQPASDEYFPAPTDPEPSAEVGANARRPPTAPKLKNEDAPRAVPHPVPKNRFFTRTPALRARIDRGHSGGARSRIRLRSTDPGKMTRSRISAQDSCSGAEKCRKATVAPAGRAGPTDGEVAGACPPPDL